MTFKTFFFAMTLVVASLTALAPAAYAVPPSLSAGVSDNVVDPGESFQVRVDVDNATGVAGSALTVEYDADAFDVDEMNEGGEDYFIVESDMFVLVQDSRPEPGTPASTIPSVGNMGEPSKVLVSGAYVDTQNGGGAYTGPQTLFKVAFKADMAAIPGFYTFTWTNSQICNLDAGWGNDNNPANGQCDPGEEEPVPALVGAVDNSDPAWGGEDLSDDFPVLLTTFTPVTTEVKIPDNDSIDDNWERQHFGDLLNVATDSTDADHDGYLDKYEQPTQNNTDPAVQDAAWDLPNYNPATDDRGPYQTVITDPASPTANAGENFTMVVNYDTTDANKNLSGLGLRIHYNSTKLTWAGFSDVLETGKIVEDTEPSDDTGDIDGDPLTDKYVTVEWADDGNAWPGIDLPAALYTASFTATEGLTEGETTVINFTASSTDPEYLFHGESAEVRPCSPGDVNGDGEITAQDAVDAFWLSLQASWTPAELCVGDINEDGEITAQDATDIFWLSLQ